ncbi:hypothetical protein ABKV19_007870 [Rosa sericea]
MSSVFSFVLRKERDDEVWILLDQKGVGVISVIFSVSSFLCSFLAGLFASRVMQEFTKGGGGGFVGVIERGRRGIEIGSVGKLEALIRIHATIEDPNSEATVKLRGKPAEQLFGITCRELIDRYPYAPQETLP